MSEARHPSTGDVARNGRHDAECPDRAGKAVAAEHLLQSPLRPRALLAKACGQLLGRVLLELHVEVADGGGLVSQPAKVVAEHVPATEGEPDAQPGDAHTDLVHGLRVIWRRVRRSQVMHEVPKPWLRGDWRVSVDLRIHVGPFP